MRGYRKLTLGLAYLVACTLLGYWQTHREGSSELLGLAAVFGGLATGVAAIVWGNVKNHEADKAS